MNLLRISQYIQRFISIYLTTMPGGYRRKKIQFLRHLFHVSADFLNKTGEDYWLDFGTLLGYHREQDIIPHDIDVDFAMHEKSYEKILAKKHLLPKGFKFYDSSHRHHGPKLYLNYKGFDVDIYFYEDLGEALKSYEDTHFPNERQEIPKTFVYPLKKVQLFDQAVSIPSQTKKYLEYIYGYIGRGGKRNLKTGFWEER